MHLYQRIVAEPSPLPLVEPPKGSSPLPLLSRWSSPLKGPLLSSPLWSSPLKGPLLSLLVEHLKVMAALSVEPASLMLIGWGYGRAPPDLNSRACFLDAYWVGLWSSASGPYQSSPLKGPLLSLLVEHLKVLSSPFWSST